MGWLFDAKNAGLVGGIGLILSVIGTVVSAIGFPIAIIQLVRTASATKAAADAVDGVKSRVAAYDVIYELSRAAAGLGEVRKHLKNDSWLDVLDSYASVTDALVRISELPSVLDENHRAELRAMVKTISASSGRIEAATYKGAPGIDRVKALRAAAGYLEQITRMRIAVEKAI